ALHIYIDDQLPYIHDRNSRRAELQVASVLALLFTRHVVARSIERDGYRKRILANSNGRNHGVGRGVDDRDAATLETGHVGAGSSRRDGYPKTEANCNRRNHGVGRGLDDRDFQDIVGKVGTGTMRRSGY